jgi:hypothetical protein
MIPVALRDGKAGGRAEARLTGQEQNVVAYSLGSAIVGVSTFIENGGLVMKRSIRTSILLIAAISSLLLLSTCDVWVSIFGADQNNILQWMPSSITQGTKEAFKFSGTGGLTGATTFLFGTVNKSDTAISMKVTVSNVTGYYMLWPSGTYYWNASSSKDAIFWSMDDFILESTDILMLQTPVKSGGSWAATGDWTFDIQSTKQKVTVDAGSYSDVAIVTGSSPSYPTETRTFYWSVKQGLVRVEDSYTSGGTKYSYVEELSSITAP